MVKKLRHRLTWIFTILTSLVLAAAMCLTYYLASQQYQTSAEVYFSSSFSTLVDKLMNNDEISDVWLAEQEASSLSVIYIEDNGTPLHFPGAWQPQTDRDTLIGFAREIAQNRMNDTSYARKQSISFTLNGTGGESYQGSAAIILRTVNTAEKKSILLIMLHDTTAVLHHQKIMAIQYLFLWLVGSLILGVISWYLSGMALVPTKQALCRQNEFVAAASHELRSPLAVIKASIAAARETEIPLQNAQDFLKTAESEINRMTRLNDDLLLLAGCDAKVWRMDLAPIQLDTFCIELYEQYHLLAKEMGHSLFLSLPDDALPTIQADAEWLKQMFAILLNNALEYTTSGTPIEIIAERINASVCITIADHGKGIPDEEKCHIFDRFYRSDKSRSDKTHFGLGLSIAKEIAVMHDAELTVKDTQGGGASFQLMLLKIKK